MASAYASGALVKCRKVGAANWGNSTKKEGFTPSQIAALEHIGAVELNEKGQKCWKGYEKKGTKKMFGKTYNNNCVKKEEVDVQASDSSVSEAATLPRQNGQVMRIFLTFRGKFFMTQMFFPSLKVPSKAEITDAVQKVYPDARVTQYTMTTPDPTQPLIRVAEDVQRQQKIVVIRESNLLLTSKNFKLRDN